MRRLEGKVAVVTGGSGGIGSPTMRRFVAEGAARVCAGIDHEAGGEPLGGLAGAAARARGRAAVDGAVARSAGVDVPFNTAATSTGGYVADLDADGWERSLRVMLTASLYGMQAVIPHMLAQGGGSIISTASIYGLV